MQLGTWTHRRYGPANALGGQCWLRVGSFYDPGQERDAVAWLEKSVAQGERYGMISLHDLLCDVMSHGVADIKDEARGKRLLQEGAELGDALCQRALFFHLHASGKPEAFAWLRRCAMQCPRLQGGMLDVLRLLPLELDLYDGGRTGLNLFELGRALVESQLAEFQDSRRVDVRRAAELYHQWIEEARRAIACCGPRDFWVSKDIRLMIADLSWDDRAAWSDRARDLARGDVAR